MPNSVIFTSIFGNYDTLKDPIFYDEDMSYICFTDNPKLISNIWDIRLTEPQIPGDGSKSSKFIKICPHRFLDDFKYSLYIDGTMTVKAKFKIPYLLDGEKIAIEIHPCRDCIYEEAKACIILNKVDPYIVNKQLNAYAQADFPRHAGLYANWIIAREHNDPDLIELSEMWWDHVVMFSKRDQISFPFVFKDFPITPLTRYLRGSLVDMSTHIHYA